VNRGGGLLEQLEHGTLHRFKVRNVTHSAGLVRCKNGENR
jgi:hypothetical protein